MVIAIVGILFLVPNTIDIIMGSFVLPSLQIDPISFWSSLHHLKLERFKLEEGPFPLWGFLDVGKSHAFVKLDANSFLNKEQANLDADAKHSSFAIPGHLLVSNTFSNYKSGSWKKSALSSVSKIVNLISIHLG